MSDVWTATRARAIELLQRQCAHERNKAGHCRRPGAHARDIDLLRVHPELLRALLGAALSDPQTEHQYDED